MGVNMSDEVKVVVERLRRTTKFITTAIIIVVLTIIIVAIIFSNIIVADVGEAEVIIDPWQGRIVGVVFGPAWAIKAPWQYTKEVYVAVQVINFSYSEGTAIEALTKDGARINVDVTVRFEVRKKSEAVEYLVSKYARAPMDEVKTGVIIPIVRQVVRDVISSYTLTEVIEKRAELPSIIVNAIRERLEQDETVRIALNIIDVAVRRIIPPETVLKAIEEKLQAQQRAEAARYELQRQLTLANATRMSRIIQAEGEKEALILQAEGQKQALTLLASALNNDTQALIWYYFVQNIPRFNGTLIIILVPPYNQSIPTPIFLPIRS